MREQLSLMATGFERKTKITRRTQFLIDMDALLPWKRLRNIVKKVYYKGEGVGRPPIELERMLRIYFLQLWFNLSDPAVEEALYDIASMRAFAKIDLGTTGVPDETTVCKFRHLLEKHDIGKKLLKEVNAYLADHGIKVGSGTIVDATIIHAASSTKNESGERDPEMHSTKKGNQWYFGMKAHIGVDSRTKLVHTVVATPANVHDSVVVADLLHGAEKRVYGDSAYVGKGDAIRDKAPEAKLFINKRAYINRTLSDFERAANRHKSAIRARVEHQFGTMKCIFGFRKVRYRGLKKNANFLHALFALTNLFLSKKRLRPLLTG
jgi:transposase, IS5 family